MNQFETATSVLSDDSILRLKRTVEWISNLRSPSFVTDPTNSKELTMLIIQGLRFCVLGFCFSDVGKGCVNRVLNFKPCFSVEKMRTRCLKMHTTVRVIKTILDLSHESEVVFTGILNDTTTTSTTSILVDHKRAILDHFDKYIKLIETSSMVPHNDPNFSHELEFYIHAMFLLITVAWMGNKTIQLTKILQCDPDLSIFKIKEPEKSLFLWGQFCGEFSTHSYWSSTLIQAGSTENILTMINDVSTRLRNNV